MTTTATLVLLHGHDDDPAAFTATAEALAASLGDDTAVVVPLGPVETGNGRRAWWDAASAPDEAALDAAIGNAVATLDAALADLADLLATPDQQREPHAPGLVVVGFSQGAALLLTWLVDGQRSVRPDAVVAIAGWLEALPTTAGADARSTTAGADAEAGLAGLPVLVVYGEDDEVVPPPATRAAAKVLERRGAQITLTEVATGHTPLDAFVPTLTAWLANPS